MIGRVIGKNKTYETYPSKYIVDDKCNKCGVCITVCPAKNIIIDGAVNFADKCEACFACLHLCPQNALRIKKEKSNKRWLNPDVTATEIIAANNRFDKS